MVWTPEDANKAAEALLKRSQETRERNEATQPSSSSPRRATSHKSMFKELFSSMPLGFRIMWVAAPLLGLGFMGFVMWAIYRVVMATT